MNECTVALVSRTKIYVVIYKNVYHFCCLSGLARSSAAWLRAWENNYCLVVFAQSISILRDSPFTLTFILFKTLALRTPKKTTINFVSSNSHLKNLIFSLQLIKQKFVQFDFVNSCIGTVMSDQKNLIKMVPCLKDSDPDLTET